MSFHAFGFLFEYIIFLNIYNIFRGGIYFIILLQKNAERFIRTVRHLKTN